MQMTARAKKYKEEFENNELVPFGRGRVKKIFMNEYPFQMETLEGDAKVVFIDTRGYMNFNSARYQEYNDDVRRVRSAIKHKSYQLCRDIFPTMNPKSFIFDFDTSETSSHKIFRNSNYFDISICIKFPHQVDVKDKYNDDLETFAGELIHFMTNRYILSPISPKKHRELGTFVEPDYSSADVDFNELEYQDEIQNL